MKTKILSLIYFLSSLLFIVCEGQSSFLVELVLKALIIPVLIILFVINIRPYKDRIRLLMAGGLLSSWAGDVILEFTKRNDNMFVFGLAGFLLAHIMYFTVFIGTPGKNAVFNKRIYLLIPVILYGTILISYLYNDLNNMRIPVILYAFVILIMLAGAINRIEKVNSVSFYLVLTGAILFVISDSAIAVNKFSHTFEYSSIVIMSTYVIAQFLIVSGFLKQFRKNLV